MSRDREWPQTAAELMSSRFAAFRDGDADWLLATWHPDTRPHALDLDLDGGIVWRGLQIVDRVRGGVGDDVGIVEFRASYLSDGVHGVLHERSRFARVDGKWVYVGGDVFDEG